MSLLRHVFGHAPATPAQAGFIYLKLPSGARLSPQELALEAALVEVLDGQQLGSLISAGGSLGAVAADGFRHIAHRRLDLDVNDLDRARELLHRLLPQLGAPRGTELHYTAGTRRLQDTWGPLGWRLAEATDTP